MIIIGERINSSRKPVANALAKKDAAFFIYEANQQMAAGADYIDINCASALDKEKDDMQWLVKTIQQDTNLLISIDSPDIEVIRAALEVCKGEVFINSFTADEGKLAEILSTINLDNVFVIVLAMNEKQMPKSVEDRLKLARAAVKIFDDKGFGNDRVFIDPLVKPVSSEPEQAKYFLEAVKALKKEGIKTIGGISNASFGLPKRGILNAAFLSLAIQAGIDGAIIDPTNELIQDIIKEREIKGKTEEAFNLAKDALLGQDQYCTNYIKAFREGRI